MEHHPRKTKAFIITFIAILILLIVGYLVFRNTGTIFGIKSSGNTNKIFSPLLGTSKQNTVDVKPVNTGGDTPINNTSTTLPTTNLSVTDPSGIAPGSVSAPIGQGGTTNPNGAPVITPPFNPLPTPTTDCVDASGNLIQCNNTPTITNPECSDSIDNDKDGLSDAADSSCHTDYNASNMLSYDKNINDESRLQPITGDTEISMCPDDPLVFTEEEKVELATLLRQYYLLAPTLKIEDDVTLVDYDNQTNEELVKQATSLTNDCNAQKASPGYTGPQAIKDNPYYQNPVANSGAKEYIPGYSLYELMFNIW